MTKPHGTAAAARRHYRHGEKPLKKYCTACYLAQQFDAQDKRKKNQGKPVTPVTSPLADEVRLLHELFPDYSMRQLARQLNVSHQHVSRILAGQRTMGARATDQAKADRARARQQQQQARQEAQRVRDQRRIAETEAERKRLETKRLAGRAGVKGNGRGR
jgi:hypothetical protein